MFTDISYQHLSKNDQKIRNPFLFCSKIKVSNQNDTKQKSGEFLMLNSTTNTYILKREILNFSNKISRNLSKPERKFTADITYGMLAGGSCLLTDIVDQLHEPSKNVTCGYTVPENSVETNRSSFMNTRKVVTITYRWNSTAAKRVYL